jgi:hypothetical protein
VYVCVLVNTGVRQICVCCRSMVGADIHPPVLVGISMLVLQAGAASSQHMMAELQTEIAG